MSPLDFIFWISAICALPFLPLVLGWSMLFPPKGQSTPGVLFVMPIPIAFVGYLLLTIFVSKYFLPLVLIEALGVFSVWHEVHD